MIENVFNASECYAICEKENNVAIGAVELKLNGHTDMTDKDDVPVPLLNEVRVGHTNIMTKEQWNRQFLTNKN